MTSDDALADLLHRVNNLLATIETQCEVAQALGTHDACREALQLIRDSARRTQATVRALRQPPSPPA